MARYRLKKLAKRKQLKLRKLALATVWQSSDNYDTKFEPVTSNNDEKNLSLMAQHLLEMLKKRKEHKERKRAIKIAQSRGSIDMQKNTMRHIIDTGDNESMIGGIQNDSRDNGFSSNNAQSNKGSIWLSLDAYRKAKENSIQPNRDSGRSGRSGDSIRTEEYQFDTFNRSMDVENLGYESSEQIDDPVHSDEYQSDETRNVYPNFYMENGGNESFERNDDSVDDNQSGYPGTLQLVYQNQLNIYTDDRRVIY